MPRKVTGFEADSELWYRHAMITWRRLDMMKGRRGQRCSASLGDSRLSRRLAQGLQNQQAGVNYSSSLLVEDEEDEDVFSSEVLELLRFLR